MKGSVSIVCTPAVASGFRLTGVAVWPATDGAAAAAALRDLLAAPATARPVLVLVEEGLLGALPPDLQRRLAGDPALLAVPFPGPAVDAAATAASFLLDLLRQAIGYRVRLT